MQDRRISPRLYVVLQDLRTAAYLNQESAKTCVPRSPVPSCPTAPAGNVQKAVLCVVPDMPTYVKDGLLWAAVQWMVLCPVGEPCATLPFGASAVPAANTRTTAPPLGNGRAACGCASALPPQFTCPHDARPLDHLFAAPDQHRNTAVQSPPH